MRFRIVLAASVAMLLAGVVRTTPVYDKTAQVFLSRTTADGIHVGDHVCFETTRAIDCFPDQPRTDYRLEFPDDTFATCRFIAGTNDDLDAIAMIFEKKDKNTRVRFRLIEPSKPHQPYTIGVPYSDRDATGRSVEREARYRVYPDK